MDASKGRRIEAFHQREDALRLEKKKENSIQKAAVAAFPFFRKRVGAVAIQP
jgi:heme oxygenase